MRIVHITDSYPPHRHPIADQVAGLARRQGQRGDAVHVLTATPVEVAVPGKSRYRTSAVDAPGVRTHRLASPLALGLPVLPRGRAIVERALGLLRPDVVHLHLPGPSPFGYDAARAARGMDLPLVISAYSGGPETFSKFAVRLAGWATASVVTSGVNTFVAEQVAEVFGGESPHVLPLATDLAPWRAAGERWREVKGLRILVHGGDRVKKISSGLDGARASVGERVTVTAAGPGASGVSGPDNPLGDVPGEVLPTLGSEHDVYVSAAGLDRHAAGAAASGLVLVGFADTGVRDILGQGGIAGDTGVGGGGFIVEGAPDIEHAIVKLAESPALRRRMRTSNLSSGAALELQTFDWPQVCAGADFLYRQAHDRIREYGDIY